ncbi:MAG: ABC transporter ATP-binding protein [Actinomyces sp.]|uniref:ABC transporter ATP-binding protein n=1 Tax=Actinomyces sp. TaxID=29317 RepID=UPI002901C916|nr:ABC transporter ATP-binding protein [Actinomyces sp.]MDU1431547.1 ABC transporter ATP-binding protein [Actinomyces sp.]
MGEETSADSDVHIDDPRAAHRAGQQAFKELTAPIRGSMMVARVLGFLYGALAVAPYVILVHLGEVLLAAARSGVSPDRGEVISLLMWLIGAFGARYGIYFLALGVTHFADLRFGHIVRSRMVKVLSGAPLAWFTSTNSGAVRKAIQDDTHDVHTVIAHAPVESTAAISAPLSLLIYAFVVDWRLGLLSIATMPIYGLIYAWMLAGMGDKTAQMDRHLTRVSATMVEFVSGISVVKAFGTVGRSHQRFTQAAEDFSRFYRDWCGPMLRGSALGQASVSPSLILLISTSGGAALAAARIVSPVQVITCALIALVIPAAIEVLGTTAWAYQIAGAAALRIVNLLSVTPLPATGTVVPTTADIEIDDVCFSYGSTLALDHVSLRVPEGSITALVGASGSGKSTLATLVARFADPDRGAVRIGGVDARDIAPDVLYRHVSFVLQDPQLLDISVRDNIALGVPGASDEAVWAAAGAARIDDYLRSLPRGLDSVIGEDAHPSGGQAQRIAIARALLVDAPILVLDEATAFTDPEAEADIQAALTRLVQGKTVLVIAHRAASIVGVDQIAILDAGRLIASGTPEQLADHPYMRRMSAVKGH